VAFDPLALVRPHVRNLAPQRPGPPADELERRFGLGSMVQLAANENALGPSPLAVAAMARAAASGHRYPDGGGFHLKHRLAQGLGLTPEHFALGAGSNELISLLVHLFVGPGDEVVAAHPSFVMYGACARAFGGTFVGVPGTDGGLTHDLDGMLAAIGPRTKLVFVCNPNNPTGSLIGAAAFERFLARVPAHVVVASDEAYREYVDDDAYPDTLSHLADERAFVILRTFSKIHSLAGLRVGYAIARPEMAQLFDRVRLPFQVNALAQAAACAALDDTAHVEASRALAQSGRAALLADLAALGIAAFPSCTNFVLADFGRDCRPLCATLAERGVLVRDLTGFGMDPRFARIGVGTKDEHARLVEALSGALRGAAGAA
jgi:histidinol-phosphate aminotransferase